MSDDQYHKRLEPLFSGTEPVEPEPAKEARAPTPAQPEAGQAQVAVLKAAAASNAPSVAPGGESAQVPAGEAGSSRSGAERAKRGMDLAEFEDKAKTPATGLSFTARYAVAGAAFGFLFPLLATAIVVLTHALPLRLSGFLEAQRIDPLLWIIDTAPFFLGLFASFAGQREDRLRQAYARLRESALSLEEGVEGRTHDLLLAAEVMREASQVHDLEALLAKAAELIRARFDLYYTQIYLTDPTGRALKLHAGTGPVGAELLRRGHRLAVGPGSINGTAAADKRSIIVADTLTNAIFRPNPLLPYTRSEMSVPLIVGNQVVGVLDMQSDRPGALTAENLPVFGALAGQLAIAIQNARLFDEVAHARAEVEARARRLVRTGWEGFLDAAQRSERLGYVYDLTRLTPLEAPLPVVPEGQALSVPLTVGGEPIGAVQLEDDPDRRWTPDEKDLVTTVAQQVARHVENLRLLADAERYRAEAEEATRRLTREGWETYLETVTASTAYTYDHNQVMPSPAETTDGSVGLAQPLQVRGEAIGELAVEDTAGWSEQAAELVSAVADQLSAHIESLRLSEQTQLALAETENQARRLALLNEMSTQLNQAAKLNDILTVAASRTREIVASDWATVTLLNAEGDQFEIYMLQADGGAAPLGQPFPVAGTAVEIVAQEKRLIVVPDAQASDLSDMHGMAERGGRSVMLAPLAASGRVLGTLNAASEKPNAFSWRDESLLQQIVSLVASAIENLRLLEQTQKRAAELETVAKVSTTASTTLEAQHMLQTVVDLTKSSFGLYHAHIYLLNDIGDTLVLTSGAGDVGRRMVAQGRTIPLRQEQSLVARAARTRKGVVVNDVRQAPDFLPHPLLPETRSEMAIPLIVADKVLGVFDVQANVVERFTDEDVRIQTTLAAQVAVALQNTRLFEGTQHLLGQITQERERLALLYEVMGSLIASLDMDAVLDTALQFAPRLGAQHAYVLLLGQTDSEAMFRGTVPGLEHFDESEANAFALAIRDHGLERWVLEKRRPAIVRDTRQDKRWYTDPSHAEEEPARSVISVPFETQRGLLKGVLAYTHPVPSSLTEDHLLLIESIASQVAVALENAKLYAEQAATVTRLRELDHLKSSFLANMSHELRTPLNSILGFTDVMLEELDGPLTDLMRNDLEVVRKNGRHLLSLINDVLDMAKIEAGKLNLIPERFNLQEVLEEVMDIAAPLARDKALDLRLDTDPLELLDLEADRMRVRQVMINLVNNAIKFTDSGYVSIRATQAHGWIRVTVQDTGLGIPTSQLETIFQEFHQVDSSTTRKAGGTGLGLPISRHLIEMHGGKLWVESTGQAGEGSTFHVELPVETVIGMENN